MTDRLKKQLAFALEIDKEKNIFRQTHLSGHGRRENDAEHAWHMAIMAYLLREYANEEVDITRVMLMCLIHDIVEIDAGDTYAYDDAGLATQKAREEAAKERIYSILPEDQKQEFTHLFDEFEARETPESRFAHSMDNLQPLLLNDSNGGGDWREHQVSAEKVYGRQRQTRFGSETLYEVTDAIIRRHIAAGNLRTDPDSAAENLQADPDSAAENLQADPESAAKNRGTDPGSAAGTASDAVSSGGTGEASGSSTEAAFADLVDTVARLRAPDGCPWDRAQTHLSLKPACIEEAAEVLCGINILDRTGSGQNLCEELGDLLLQVVMHAQIAEDEGLFTLKDVIEGINRKMVRRHPHVFGEKSLRLLSEISGIPLEAMNVLHSRSGQEAGEAGQQGTGKTGEQERDKEIQTQTPQGTLQDLVVDWKMIKTLEKQGRADDQADLFDAFTEAEELIRVARRRKELKQ